MREASQVLLPIVYVFHPVSDEALDLNNQHPLINRAAAMELCILQSYFASWVCRCMRQHD